MHQYFCCCIPPLPAAAAAVRAAATAAIAVATATAAAAAAATATAAMGVCPYLYVLLLYVCMQMFKHTGYWSVASRCGVAASFVAAIEEADFLSHI